MFEVELEAMPQEQAEFEVARRFVNLAAASARNAALATPAPGVAPQTIARASVARAARTWAPGLHRRMLPAFRGADGRWARPGYRRPYRTSPYGGPSAAPMQEPLDDGGSTGVSMSGRWVRRGRKIVVLGA
jgi:hypothetical protein